MQKPYKAAFAEPLLTQQLSIFLLTEQERYQAASMSWQHPETSYLPTTLSALQAAKSSPDDLIAQRHAAWQQAFRGLYYAMRHRKCDAFYLATPQVSHASGFPKQPCTEYSACSCHHFAGAE